MRSSVAGVWAELMGDDEVRDALPALAALGLRLQLALPAARLGDPELARLGRDAADQGVRIGAWLLLPREDGYWIHEGNVEAVDAAVRRLLAWRDSPGGLGFDTVSFDLEPAYAYSEALREAQRTDPSRWLSLLREHLVPERFARARDALARTVDRVTAAGVRAHAVTYPLVLDQPAGSSAIEDALDVPVSGLAWSEVSFMVYETPFAQQAGSWFGPALIHDYARTAVERFGERAGIDLGIVGEVGLGVDPGDRYPDPDSLRADVAAALAAGVRPEHVRVYSLAGLLAEGGVARWLGGGPPEPREPPPSRAVRGLRNLVGALAGSLG
ncbi:MAG: hypothetical protein IT376_10690 [Polyangiaceae bacterium]|nr:hypothetical protein [Polyangiaceae bacterium]